MSANERIKELRKHLNLTQAEFGEKIGLKQAVIGQMENGSRNLTDRTVILLCEKYSVREEWLQYGKGAMFNENDDALISEVSTQYGLTGLDKQILKIFLELPKDKREQLKRFAFDLVDTVLTDDLLRAEFESQYMSSDMLAFKNDSDADSAKIPEPHDTGSDEVKVFRAASSETYEKPEIFNESRDRISTLQTAPKVTSDDAL